MTEKLIYHLPFALITLILAIYLGAKAIPENSWDGWRVGSAQTLLSAKHWAQDGFLNNYLLFLPQGYSKTVRYFDDPALRQHTRGITTGGLIGKRLYYTHYPSGYLLWPALFAKMGIENRVWFRLTAILFSLIGLTFLYWFFTLISNRLTASLAAAYYGFSVLFLDYADTVSNHMIDAILLPLIMLLSAYAIRRDAENKNYNRAVWVAYFVLASSSYDSTVFVFAWLVALDLIILKKINWRKWFFWASAPALAGAVQVLQNVLYLGWRGALFDFLGALKVQIVGSKSGFFISHFRRLIEPFGWFFGVRWYLGIVIAILGILGLWYIKKHLNPKYFHYFNNESKIINYSILGFLALLFHFLFFPSLFFYQGRIVAIFGGLLIGILTVTLVKIISRDTNIQMHSNGTNKIRIISINSYISIGLIIILVSGLWFIQGKRTYTYIKHWPNNVWPAENIDFDKKIKNLVSGDKVVFQISKSNQKLSEISRYPAAASEDEYYIDAPILGFKNKDDLIRDLDYLKRRSDFSFTAIIIADEKETAEKLGKELQIEKIRHIENKFVLLQKFAIPK